MPRRRAARVKPMSLRNFAVAIMAGFLAFLSNTITRIRGLAIKTAHKKNNRGK